MAFAGVGFGVSQLLTVTKILPVLRAQFTDLFTVLMTPHVTGGVYGMGDALTAVGGAGKIALPVLLAVGAAIFGIVEAVKAYKAAHPDLETLGERFKEENASIQETSDNPFFLLSEVKKLTTCYPSRRGSCFC